MQRARRAVPRARRQRRLGVPRRQRGRPLHAAQADSRGRRRGAAPRTAWPGRPPERREPLATGAAQPAHARACAAGSAMRTLIVSDLHLGSVTRADLLRRPELRAPLLEAAADVERVVLLGDVLELRHGPPRDALAAARPFFEELGAALAGRELVIVAGNHDHALVEPWLVRRGAEPEARAARRRAAAGAGRGLACARAHRRVGLAGTSARRLSGAVGAPRRVRHPRSLSRLPPHGADARASQRRRDEQGAGRPPSAVRFRRRLRGGAAPVFAWRDAVARDARRARRSTASQRSPPGTRSEGLARARAAAIQAPRRSLRATLAARLRARALIAGFPLAVAALNRAGVGPLRADVSMGELRRAGLRAMGEVAAASASATRTSCSATLTARGRYPATTRWTPPTWRGAAGARLVNTGSWTYARLPHRDPRGEPVLAGRCVLVEDAGPPVLRACCRTAPRELSPPARSQRRVIERLRAPQASPGVKHVARQLTLAPISSSSTPAVWRSCSSSAYAPGARPSNSRWRPPRRHSTAPLPRRRAPPTRRPLRTDRSRRPAGLPSAPPASHRAHPRGAAAPAARVPRPSSSWIASSVSA